MATDKRQKYNFLVALTRQLKEARDDEGDEYADFQVELARLAAEPGEYNEWATRIDDRLGKCEQWLAALETALESVEHSLSAWDGDDDSEPDDGDADPDVGPVEPQVGGLVRGGRPRALAVGDTGGQPSVIRRTVAAPREKRRLRGGTQ